MALTIEAVSEALLTLIEDMANHTIAPPAHTGAQA